ncbi:hypothetical protein GGR56DRAFT_466739 [Xylariaceae sp. FL0804]|nr:hypothetical protein GGR56DRAFT_466739 [Xylariaceae sp. FL0804]
MARPQYSVGFGQLASVACRRPVRGRMLSLSLSTWHVPRLDQAACHSVGQTGRLTGFETSSVCPRGTSQRQFGFDFGIRAQLSPSSGLAAITQTSLVIDRLSTPFSRLSFYLRRDPYGGAFAQAQPRTYARVALPTEYLAISLTLIRIPAAASCSWSQPRKLLPTSASRPRRRSGENIRLVYHGDLAICRPGKSPTK